MATDLVHQLSRRGLDCVCGNLRMAARAVTSVYDRHLAAAGVQASQMAVLWAVSSADGITVKEIASRLAMHETTLIRNLRILEREGWVELQVGADRRQRIASLTQAGRAVFGKALRGWKKAQSEVALLLDDDIPETNRKLVRLARAAWARGGRVGVAAEPVAAAQARSPSGAAARASPRRVAVVR